MILRLNKMAQMTLVLSLIAATQLFAASNDRDDHGRNGVVGEAKIYPTDSDRFREHDDRDDHFRGGDRDGGGGRGHHPGHGGPGGPGRPGYPPPGGGGGHYPPPPHGPGGPGGGYPPPHHGPGGPGGGYPPPGNGGHYPPPPNGPHWPPPGGGGGYNPPNNGLFQIYLNCGSYEYGFNECSVYGRIIRAEILTQYSRSACIFNQTWGIQENYIWVHQGCQGQFRVIYVPYNYSVRSEKMELKESEMKTEAADEVLAAKEE